MCVTRGALVESVHAAAACAVSASGRVALALGDIDAPVYLRSAAKPFIAAEVVRSGAAERFGLTPRELAVVAASHGGEPFHVAAVAGLLAKLGLGPEALRCGAHPPTYEPAAAALAASASVPSPLHSNCSGKHAGLLALALHLGADTATYLEATHPAERAALAFCARMVGEPPEALPLGIDGCGIPVFATSLRRGALAFARLATLAGIADDDAASLATVRAAMVAEPAYVAGTGRFDTALMLATGGRIACKAGAEGVHGGALVREGLGLALKVQDGATRAVAPVALAAYAALGGTEPDERAALAAFARPIVRNVAGDPVGEIFARADTIEAALAS